jgi:hypothetical protein
VSLQPAGVDSWSAAELNRPLTSGDRLWCDQDSRAELDLGAAALRLGSLTAFSFFRLDEHTAQMQLTAGTLIVQVRALADTQLYEIDTPNVAIALLQPGVYRIEVGELGETTTIAVSDGSAEVEGGGQSVRIDAPRLVRFSGAQTVSYQSAPLPEPDDFDAWSAARERGLTNSPSAAYVAQDMPGTQDLDSNGSWQLTPDYGYVWAPAAVAVGWAPYRFGHWAWIAPWGWTWVDAAPWGFAPYHYGRWVLWNSAWCWVPGPRRVHPVYAPAVVGWVGGPGRPGALGANVGWFPLGPHEVYVPPYEVSSRYAHAVNLTNTIVSSTYVDHIYQAGPSNLRYLNNTTAGASVVPQGALAAGEPTRGRLVPVGAGLLAGAALASAPAIAPQRQSVTGPALAYPVRHPPATYLNRSVLARTAPPRAPASFERQLTAIQANGGRALPGAELARLQPAAAAAPVRVLAGNGSARARGNALPDTLSDSSPTLAERERALEMSTLGSQPREDGVPPIPLAGATAAPPTQAAGSAAAPPPGEHSSHARNAATMSNSESTPAAQRYRTPEPHPAGQASYHAPAAPPGYHATPPAPPAQAPAAAPHAAVTHADPAH